MKYSKSNLSKLAPSCISLSEMVRVITGNSKAHGGSVAYLKRKLDEYGIDYSHFKGRSWCTGLNNPTGLAYSKDAFIDLFLKKNGKFIISNTLKWKLIKFGLKDYVCEICGNDGTWMGKELVLQIDHEDGDKSNNELSNLKIKCPNCHSQTITYAGKNNKRKNAAD